MRRLDKKIIIVPRKRGCRVISKAGLNVKKTLSLNWIFLDNLSNTHIKKKGQVHCQIVSLVS